MGVPYTSIPMISIIGAAVNFDIASEAGEA